MGLFPTMWIARTRKWAAHLPTRPTCDARAVVYTQYAVLLERWFSLWLAGDGSVPSPWSPGVQELYVCQVCGRDGWRNCRRRGSGRIVSRHLPLLDDEESDGARAAFSPLWLCRLVCHFPNLPSCVDPILRRGIQCQANECLVVN